MTCDIISNSVRRLLLLLTRTYTNNVQCRTLLLYRRERLGVSLADSITGRSRIVVGIVVEAGIASVAVAAAAVVTVAAGIAVVVVVAIAAAAAATAAVFVNLLFVRTGGYLA